MTFNRMRILFLIALFSLFGAILIDGTCSAIKVTGTKGIVKNVADLYIKKDHCGGDFYVSLEFGDKCEYNNSNICGNAVKHFKCINPGDSCSKNEGYVNSIKVWSAADDEVKKWKDYDGDNVFKDGHPDFGRYKYYFVRIYVDEEFQDMEGIVFKKRLYKLTVTSKDESGNSLSNVTGLSDNSTKAFYGKTATVAHRVTSTGYNFLYWIDENGNRYGNSGTTSYSTTMNKNKTVTAVYRAFSATATLDIKSKKSTQSEYKDDIIYAKPTDIINFQTTYSPSAQGGYSLRPQKISVNDGNSWAINTTLGQAFSGWSNSFNISGMVSDNYNYQNGSTDKKTINHIKNYTVPTYKVGSELDEKASLHDKTPKTVRIGLEGGSGGVSIGRIYTNLSDTVKVRVPYNFENKPNKPGHPKKDDPNPNNPDDPNNPGNYKDGSEKIAYAGETDNFEFTIDVETRLNPVTEGDYATFVKNAKWRLGLCIGTAACNNSDYKYSNEESGNLNESRSMEGEKGTKKRQLSINIPDIAAGSKICIVAEVFPKTSGAYTNWNDTNYDGTWARSPRSCYTIAKRPSIQIWGGNVYSRGNLSTSTAVKTKKNLQGYAPTSTPYSAVVDKNQAVRAFGSWGELGVISNGAINGFGSGASMGYARNDGIGADGKVKTWPSYHPNDGVGNIASGGEPGGGRTNNFCDWIPLTIPNSQCGNNNNTAGGLSSVVGITKASNDKKSIIDLQISGVKTSNHTHSDTDMTINRNTIGDTIEGSTARVISSNGNITISADAGDLTYLNKPYLNYDQMPKLVIYAKGNININCGVGRIDALLIADNTVNTCADSNDINSEKNSKQLFVNGAIIATRLIANRTYGAATGANSIVPAEVINFDPTLYQFGGSAEANDDTTGRLDVSYMHELPPRL